MRHLMMFIIALLLSACASTANESGPNPNPNLYYAGGDGTSYKQAVLFPAAKSSMEGVPLERKWLTEKYPGFKKTMQAVSNFEGKIYDVITIHTADGEEKRIYFDMTNWFGIPGLR